MQITCMSLAEWAERFAAAGKTTMVENGGRFDVALGLGHAEIRPLDAPPANWGVIELVYPSHIEPWNRDGVRIRRFSIERDSPFQTWRSFLGEIVGYKRRLEIEQQRGNL